MRKRQEGTTNISRKRRLRSYKDQIRKRKTNMQEEDDGIQNDLYLKFHASFSKRRQAFLKEKLSEYYGKNFAIKYKDCYEFDEQWENKVGNGEAESKDECNYQQSIFESCLSLAIILIFTGTLWFSSIEFFVRNEGSSKLRQLVYSIALTAAFLDLSMNLRKGLKMKIFVQFDFSRLAEYLYQNIACCMFLVLKVAGIEEERGSIVWITFEVINLYLMYSRSSQIYKSIRLMNFSVRYEYQIKVVDLILTLIFTAHFIAIVLVLVTRAGHEVTWLSVLDIDRSDEFQVYLYAYYFCSTTILTVGYGDISPKNASEVALVTFVEIFGIVVFAYIINEIGYSISSMRKDREILDKDLASIDKIRKHYNTSEILTNRARSYIIHNQEKKIQLSPEEESNVMLKLNEELRVDLSQNNNLQIIKSSIFFLCRWSKTFQKEASIRLNHILFNPNDIVYQPQGKERIYILKAGTINLYAEKAGRKCGLNNRLKTIESTIEKEISNNCYGYTSVLSQRPVKLYAIARDFSSMYFIEKEKFIESLGERISDFEYYHQIKSKIDQSFHPEVFEVPMLESSKHHFNPTITSIIRKYANMFDDKNIRRSFIRQNRQLFGRNKKVVDEKTASALRKNLIKSMESNNFDWLDIENKQASGREEYEVEMSENESEEDDCVSNQNKNVKRHFHHFFECSKEYANYFPKQNQSKIITKYEHEYYLQKNDKLELFLRCNIEQKTN